MIAVYPLMLAAFQIFRESVSVSFENYKELQIRLRFTAREKLRHEHLLPLCVWPLRPPLR